MNQSDPEDREILPPRAQLADQRRARARLELSFDALPDTTLHAGAPVASLPAGELEVIIIAMTARAMAGDRDRCLAAGMNDNLAEPVDPARLEQVTERWLATGDPASAPERAPVPDASPATHTEVAEAGVPIFGRAGPVARLLGLDEALALDHPLAS